MTIGDRAASWFNPRRQLYARELIGFIIARGNKLYLTNRAYGEIRAAAAGLNRGDVDRAVDDLFTLGMVSVRLCGRTQVIVMHESDLDARLAQPVEAR